MINDDDKASTQTFVLIEKKKWVFKDLEEEFEFIGILSGDDKLITMDPPQELLELYNMGS